MSSNKSFIVSVVMPVYNAAPFVEEAVNSALKQPEVGEILLIEDGSPDNAIEICRRLVLTDKRIRLFQHAEGKNLGAGESRNVGLRNATYPYIAFLDADDIFGDDRFKKDKELFENDETIDGVYNAVAPLLDSDYAIHVTQSRFKLKDASMKIRKPYRNGTPFEFQRDENLAITS